MNKTRYTGTYTNLLRGNRGDCGDDVRAVCAAAVDPLRDGAEPRPRLQRTAALPNNINIDLSKTITYMLPFPRNYNCSLLPAFVDGEPCDAEECECEEAADHRYPHDQSGVRTAAAATAALRQVSHCEYGNTCCLPFYGICDSSHCHNDGFC